MGKGGGTGIPFIAGTGKDNGQDGSIGGAFEFLLAEWHLPPDYILNNWTDEMLGLMMDKLIERKQSETKALKVDNPIAEDQFFKTAGIKVRKVKHGD